ncbi:MAG TPA: SDR family oxidoreductase [Ktedonobacterales bacterium]|jgi:NAD(P)-dependent dehydrogenase (short-subunit alcohol dehydrogenase family)
MNGRERRLVALVTGGSRGIGAAAARALGARGYAVALTYREKAARAAGVVADIEREGGRALALGGDITQPADVARLYAAVAAWGGRLDALILNASGGLERAALAANPDYPLRINRDAQITLLDGALPLLAAGATVVLVTSHWAHLYGRVTQLPNYEPIAASKFAGEAALRARQAEMAGRGVRLLIVTGDLIEGTITPRLLERKAPGMTGARRARLGALPTAADMGAAIAAAVADASLPSGHIIVIGGTLEALLAARADE